jgi:hypothetical protein
MADTFRHHPAGAPRPAPQPTSVARPVIRTVLAAVRSAMIAHHLHEHPGDHRVDITDQVHALPDAAVADWLRDHLPVGETVEHLAPARPSWREWDQRRLDTLRAAFERDGWHVAASGRYAESYELDLGPEGVAQALVPRTTEARDTNRRAYEAADTLIKISREPHLELGPLSDRESAWANRPVPGEPAVERETEPWQAISSDHKIVGFFGERAVVTAEHGTGAVLRSWTGPQLEGDDERARLAAYCLPKRRVGSDATNCRSDHEGRTP